MEGIENAYKARIEDAVAATRAAVEEGIVPGGGGVVEKIGATSFQIALLTSAPFVGSLFTLYWSRLSNKRSKMKFFLRVKILARATIFLMVLAINPWIFIAVVFLNALFEQAGSPAYTGIMKEIYQGIDFSLMGIRGATAPFLGVGLMNLVGIRTALLISFMVTLAAFFLMQWFRTHSSLFLNRSLKEVS